VSWALLSKGSSLCEVFNDLRRGGEVPPESALKLGDLSLSLSLSAANAPKQSIYSASRGNRNVS
jgi:hypothetical protein